MDLVRVGLVIRALRRRRGWRQLDLAARAGVSQSLISLVERGHADSGALKTLVGIAAALDARLVIDLRWRAGDLDRLLDEDHAALGGWVVRRLRDAGWDTRIEVTYADARAAGSIDLLSWHGATASLLVIEIKTELPSAEATLRKLDEKVRVAVPVARRFGWEARTVSRLLVVEGRTTARDRVRRQAALFDAAFPARRPDVEAWLRQPSASLAGLLFVRLSNRGSGTTRAAGRHRIRLAPKAEGPRSRT